MYSSVIRTENLCNYHDLFIEHFSYWNAHRNRIDKHDNHIYVQGVVNTKSFIPPYKCKTTRMQA